MARWRFKSAAPPATYAYPPTGQVEKKEEAQVAAAVLSITGKKKSKAVSAGSAPVQAQAQEEQGEDALEKRLQALRG